MPDAADKAEAFAALRAVDFSFLEELRCTRTSEQLRDSDCTLTLRLVSRDAKPRRLSIEFAGVRDLKLGDLSYGGLWVIVEPIQARQLEKLRFQVRERESGAFSFVCADLWWSIEEGE